MPAQLLPQSLEAQLRAGEMLLLGRRFPEAQDLSRRALILDPKNIRGLVLNANALAGMKRHDQAMAAIERAIQLDPTRADTARRPRRAADGRTIAGRGGAVVPADDRA